MTELLEEAGEQRIQLDVYPARPELQVRRLERFFWRLLETVQDRFAAARQAHLQLRDRVDTIADAGISMKRRVDDLEARLDALAGTSPAGGIRLAGTTR